jgi:hypothetical protein
MNAAKIKGRRIKRDRRTPAERTASGRYLQPGLFAALSGGIGNP